MIGAGVVAWAAWVVGAIEPGMGIAMDPGMGIGMGIAMGLIAIYDIPWVTTAALPPRVGNAVWSIIGWGITTEGVV